MKFFYPTALTLLLVPLAFAGVIRHDLQPSFKIVHDRDRVSSFSVGAVDLFITTTDDTLVVSSRLGNMELKRTNESFVLESVPPPSDFKTLLDTDPEPEQGGKENEKYDIVNDKLQETTTAAPPPVKYDCMNSPLRHLIVKCDGNIRLRSYTEEERAKAEEDRRLFQEQIRQRMEAFRRQMDQMREMFQRTFQGMRSSLFGGPRPDDFQPGFAPDFEDGLV